MSPQTAPNFPPTFEIELFQPDPHALYSLEVAARLAAVRPRSILKYCRIGLVRPVFQAPYGAMAFTEDAIFTIRRIETMRVIHGLDVALMKTMLDLLDEVERLRAEVRFFQRH